MPSLVLIDLNSQASFEFQFFPSSLELEGGANWEQQNTAGGKKPLFYSNSDGTRLTFPELWWDSTDTGESLNPRMDELRGFCLDEQDDRGAPPSLLATWGDAKLQCVLSRYRFVPEFWDGDGNPLRVRLDLEFLEIQDEGEATNLTGIGI